jgi:hypothetical protein
MPPVGGRWYKLTDFVHNRRTQPAMKLLIEWKNTKENFRQRCTKEVVETVISRFNEYAGPAPLPRLWVIA